MKSDWIKVVLPLLLMAVVVFFILTLAGCARRDADTSDWYKVTCNFDKVNGDFKTTHAEARGGGEMIRVYRFTSQKRREFMFPRRKITECSEDG